MNGLDRSHHFVVDQGTREDLEIGSIESPGEDQAVPPDDQNPFAGLVKIEVATAIVLRTVDPIEHPTVERERDRLDVSFPEHPSGHMQLGNRAVGKWGIGREVDPAPAENHGQSTS